jgi:hypothetical protein
MSNEESNMLKIDGADAAIVGTVSRCGCPDLLCYDYERLVTLFMKRDKMTREEAIDYIDFNILGAWMGEGTPVILFREEDGRRR